MNAETTTESTEAAAKPYALLVALGGSPADSSVRVIDITPSDEPLTDSDSDPQPHPSVQALRTSGITPADVRSRVLMYIDKSVDPMTAVCSYAALCAYAARRLDVQIGSEPVIEVSAIDSLSRSIPDVGRPSQTPELVQVGSAHPVLPSVVGSVGVAEAQVVRHAKRCRLVLFPEIGSAIAQFVAVSALRARGEQDRFPLLVADAALVADAEDGFVDLDSIRRSAVEVRRASRSDDRSALAPRGTISERNKDMLAASALPLEDVMTALGSTTPGNGVWHCPRPHRHTHGDAVPSMKVESSRARCFRCDPEWVDPVRLTADVKGCSFDEAAAWLMASLAASK